MSAGILASRPCVRKYGLMLMLGYTICESSRWVNAKPLCCSADSHQTDLNFTEARDSEWQWHQLGHMQVCTSLQTDNDVSTPPLSFSCVKHLDIAEAIFPAQ